MVLPTFQILSILAIAVVFAATAWAALRHGGATRRDRALALGSLALALPLFLDASIRVAMGIDGPILWAVGSVGLLTHPLLLMRLARRTFHLASWPQAAAVFGLIPVVALAGYGAFLGFPAWTVIPPLAYYVLAQTLAVVVLATRAGDVGGSARIRVLMAAAGAGALGLDILLRATWFLLPAWEAAITPVTDMTLVAAAVAYPLAFAAPRFQRYHWQASELRRLAERFDEMGVSRDHIAGELARAARDALGGATAWVVARDPDGWRVLEAGGETLRDEPGVPEAAAFVEAMCEERPSLLPASHFTGPARAYLDRNDVRMVAVARLELRGDMDAAVAVCLGEPSVFPEEDLALLHGMAKQAAAALRDAEALESERRRADAMTELEAFKSQFLGATAHELGNPLSPIRLRLSILEPRVADDEKSLAAVQVIRRNVGRIERLVRNMGDVARLQETKLELHPARVDLVRLVADEVEARQDEAGRQGCVLELHGDPAVRAFADAYRMEQVIGNLLSNAIKYSPGGGRIDVVVRRERDGACIAVQDEGLGMNVEQQARLFRPYGREHFEAGIPGTGLGLYIARGLVEAHGGTLDVQSPGPGLGTRFTARIPLVAGGPVGAGTPQGVLAPDVS